MRRGAKIKHGITTNTYDKNGKQTKKFPKIYFTWSMMKQRIYNPNHVAYERYKHLSVSKEWKDNFKQFYDDMNESMEKHIKKYGVLNTTLDRIDNTKGYSKENCRWATRKEQSRNMKNNVVVNGMKINELSKMLKTDTRKLYARVKNGWTFSELKKGYRYKMRPEIKKQRAFVLSHSLKKLKTAHRAILRSRFGIDTKPLTLEQTGAIYGYSGSMIGWIVKKSLSTIKE